MSQWIGDHPVILINGGPVTDRKRLTLAHELGHLSLHSSIVTAEMEEEANSFAAESHARTCHQTGAAQPRPWEVN
ncbi:MAG TPA: ImmA/IrrE family metallo-endopeptidase [Pseudonocardiaceae bacterium]|nr:ImmA/IrrE family metallo-endopeptidase [Pseudonocardiaceae bacterium]